MALLYELFQKPNRTENLMLEHLDLYEKRITELTTNNDKQNLQKQEKSIKNKSYMNKTIICDLHRIYTIPVSINVIDRGRRMKLKHQKRVRF
jgi:hypothetical protein